MRGPAQREPAALARKEEFAFLERVVILEIVGAAGHDPPDGEDAVRFADARAQAPDQRILARAAGPDDGDEKTAARASCE